MSRRLKRRNTLQNGQSPAPVESAIYPAVVEALEERRLLSAVQFKPPTTVATNNAAPYSVAIADVNGDGFPDMVVANSNGTVEVFFGQGNGNFSLHQRLSDGLSSNSAFVAVAGLDSSAYAVKGVSLEDIVVGTTGSTAVAVFINTGKGNFNTTPVDFTVTASPYGVYSVAVADINGDEDIVTGNTNGTVSVLYGYSPSNGNFRSPYTMVTLGDGPGNIRLAAGTLTDNGSSSTFLAVTNSVANDLRILVPNGNGKFLSSAPYSVGAQPDSIALGDLNNDRNTDVVVGAEDGSVTVLLGTGTGTFSQPNMMSVAQNVDTVAIADVNGDGNADIVLGGQVLAANDSTVYGAARVLFGTGNGAFQSNAPYSVKTTDSYPRVVTGALVSGDSRTDLVIANYAADNLSVLLNSTVTGTGPNGTPTITPPTDGVLSIAGTTGNDTADVTITGRKILVVVDTTSQSFPLKDVTSIIAHMQAGNDSISIGVGVPVVLADGGAGNDTIVAANFAADTLSGGAGKDSLHGGGERESLDGGTGGDSIVGGTGRDTLLGEGANDSIESNGRADIVDGAGGNDTLVASPDGDDTVTGDDGNDSISGGEGADLLIGGRGNDTLQAGGGPGDSNTLMGNQGADLLTGDFGQSDSLDGGPGRDTLIGDLVVTGIDTLYGGTTGPDSIQGGPRDSIISVAGDTVTGGAHFS